MLTASALILDVSNNNEKLLDLKNCFVQQDGDNEVKGPPHVPPTCTFLCSH